MRLKHAIVIGLTVLAAGGPPSTHGQDIPASIHTVTYLEVLPGSTGRLPSALRQYRDATRRQNGNLAAEVLQRRERANHYAWLETWKDQPSLDAHRQAPHVTLLRESLRPIQLAPLDERLLRGVSNGPAGSLPLGGAWYVLTHADALPPAARGIDALRPLADASRIENGNLRFDVLNEPTRQNHFTIIEVWASEKAVHAHAAAPHTRTFREQFQAFTGSLYDERFYKRID